LAPFSVLEGHHDGVGEILQLEVDLHVHDQAGSVKSTGTMEKFTDPENTILKGFLGTR